jgi:hypothetical protein
MSNTDMEFVGPRLPTPAQSELTGYFSQAVQAIRQGATIAGLLRIGGAGLIVFSLSLFLMQGMEATSDLHRYLLLLGQTVLLTCAGFAVGFILKEPRGAGVFFSLALVSIPANFAVLGAMIYSVAPLDNVITDYPTYASWKSTDIKELLIAGIIGLVVLIPMSVFCFAVLARHSKWWLSAAYLLASASLLIPLRETFSITLISSVCALVVLALLSNRKAKRQRISTGEEQFAKILLFFPAALMLARSAMLYSVDFHFALAIVIAVYYMLRHWVVVRSGKSVLTTSIQILTVFCSLILSGMVALLVGDNFSFIAPFLVFTLMWLALNVELTRFIDVARVRGVILGAWAVFCFSPIAMDILLFSKSSGLLTDLTLALVILVASTVTRQKLGAVLGAIALVGLLVVNGSHLFAFVLNTGWLGMAVTGTLTIVAGSMLERFWPVFKVQMLSRFDTKKVNAFDVDGLELQESIMAEPRRIAA